MRFQEFYECPKFAGKIFTLKEFKKWYSRETGVFCYYIHWNGFNIPGEVLLPFCRGSFNPLSKDEKDIVKVLKSVEIPSYVIATHKGCGYREAVELFQHEFCHAIYYLDEEYRSKVLHVLSVYSSDLKKLKDFLVEEGYGEKHLDDESNAYIAVSMEYLRQKRINIPSELRDRLVALLEEYVLKRLGEMNGYRNMSRLLSI